MEITPDTLAAVTQAVRAGRKIEAIKIYREATGVGLAEAKDFVERLEQGGGDAPPKIAGSAAPPDDRFAPVKAALRSPGGLIAAIKIYRELVPGTGLAEAKQAVEAMETAMRASGELPPQAAGKRGCAGVLMMVGGVALVVVLVLLLA